MSIKDQDRLLINEHVPEGSEASSQSSPSGSSRGHDVVVDVEGYGRTPADKNALPGESDDSEYVTDKEEDEVALGSSYGRHRKTKSVRMSNAINDDEQEYAIR